MASVSSPYLYPQPATALASIGELASTPTFLDAKAVCTALSVSKSQLYSAIRQGTFPPPLKGGRRMSRFVATEVQTMALAYIEGLPKESLRILVSRMVDGRRQRLAPHLTQE